MVASTTLKGTDLSYLTLGLPTLPAPSLNPRNNVNQDAKKLFLETLVVERKTETDPRLFPADPLPLPRSTNVYKGVRTDNGNRVTKNGQPLQLFEDECDESPAFDWGFTGKSCAQLAYAILRSEYSPQFTRVFYQDFKRTTIAQLDESKWVLTSDDITNAVHTLIYKAKELRCPSIALKN